MVGNYVHHVLSGIIPATMASVLVLALEFRIMIRDELDVKRNRVGSALVLNTSC